MAILKGVKDRIDVKVEAVCEMDNGTDVKVPFVVTFKKPTVKQLREFHARLADQYDDDGILVRPKATDEELAEEYVLGWSQLLDANGEPVPFNPQTLAEVLDAREYLEAITAGLKEVLYGRGSVMAKNSLRPARPGR